MTPKKYELVTSDSIEICGITFYRIRALRDFGNVKAGDLGGYIASEKNLSHERRCWIYDKAMVCGSTYICGDARIFNSFLIFGTAKICEGDLSIVEKPCR